MDFYRLPDDLRGNWIWDASLLDRLQSYVYCRKDFTLDEIPSSAELWIAARSLFHVYINGCHLSFGLGTCPTEGSYVWNFDVAYLLQTGVNHIGILAHNTRVARSSCRNQPSGVWAQVDIDEKPAVWTDASWRIREADGFLLNRPRRSRASGFAEKVDLRLVPPDWDTDSRMLERWEHPDSCTPIGSDHWQLLRLPAPAMPATMLPLRRIAVRGTFRKANATTSVSFAKFEGQRGDGLYAAETWIHADDVHELIFEVFADNPYRLFINGKCIKEQGVNKLSPGSAYRAGDALCFRQGEVVSPAGRLLLHGGWNHLIMFEEIRTGTPGFTIVFPDHEPEALHLLRVPDQNGMPGWSIAGPLKVPLPNILGNVVLSDSHRDYYIPVDSRPVDEGAELMGYEFDANDEGEGTLPDGEELVLSQGEYAVLDLETSVFGCPWLRIGGQEGDQVDVVCGTELYDGEVLAWDDGQENCDTLILANGRVTWMGCGPRGVRYVMLVARQVADTVRLRDIGVRVRRMEVDNPGRFECSESDLNAIWRIGKRTLEATVQEVFIDSPCKEETQYVADAMIQSWASYHVFGDFRLAAKSIKEFADTQFETGEMPAACPSGIYVNIPDYSLLWPVWLQRHYAFTGDRQLVESVLPNLEKLFSYFAHIAVPGRDVLGDMALAVGAYPFLDHGPIDRAGISTGLNAIYCRSLLSGASLLEEMGKVAQCNALRDRMTRIAHQIRELSWDAERGLFRDGWHDGDASDSITPQTNVLAIYGGIAEAEQCGAIFDRIMGSEPPFEELAVPEANNPYFKYFILETAFAIGRRRWALDYLRWYWGSMVKRDVRTWWELFDPTSDDDRHAMASNCHGYGTSPNGFLISEIAGIRPAKPGFTAVYFNPLTDGVTSVQAKIPTVYGQILVEWKLTPGGQLEAVIDASYPLEVIPELEPGLAETAIIHVSDEVTIFASDS